MPTLEFKGKQFVYAHHLGVPFRQLEIDKKRSLLEKGQKPDLNSNLIIHGDNLHALKALLPMYAGKINVIYIDPPYNTGEEGWCYNDNVRSPLMQEWLKKSANPVDKEDLERHDKWLCMMWPRLRLLYELLADSGIIFISIDDHEMHRLRLVLDELFQAENFVASVIWQKRTSPEQRLALGAAHDYILVYAKRKEVLNLSRLSLSTTRENEYKNPDDDPRGPWASVDPTGQTGHATEDQYYSVKTPSGKMISPPDGRCWALSESTFRRLMDDNRVWFGKDGDARPRIKKFLSEAEGSQTWTWWPNHEVGHNQEATKELSNILGGSGDFDNPKPTRLLLRILELATDKDDIVLDSFAGSGTTAHAVLELNRRDGGNRRFILVECEDYADKVTARRIRRVANGYSFEGIKKEILHKEKITFANFRNCHKIIDRIEGIENLEGHRFDKITKSVKHDILMVIGENRVKNAVEGIGGSFTFCALGEEINIETLLHGSKLPHYESLARYVFYTATGQTLAKVQKPRKDWFIGESLLYRVHLIYKPDTRWLRSNDSALDAQTVELICKFNKSNKRMLIFATTKFMGQMELTKRRIEFCQLPYAIHRVLGD